MSDCRYVAFVTYAHADKRVAAWVQRSLESYRLPARLARTRARTEGGGNPRRLGRIFRDREELSAGGELGATLREALRASEFLIVVCSPAAAASHWVNEEIREFREVRGLDNVLCLVAQGPPGNDRSLEACFPPALGYGQGGSGWMAGGEPIAADIRRGADGRRLAKLKLASGMLGVPLDELVRRDAQRRNRRLAGLSAASVAGMVVMGVLALVAVEARKEEQRRRAEAEDLIEFMLGDLRNRLNAVGRLDVLDAVGEKATAYYADADRSRQTDASLGRRARAFLLLGEVGDLRGDMATAKSAFERAYDITSELAERSPEDGAVLFDHAQSAFWIGFYDWRLGDLDRAERAFSEYLALARRLTSLDAHNPAWMAEFGHANYNLGVLALQRGRAREAAEYLDLALTAFGDAIGADPERTEWSWSLAQTHAWLADAYELSGDFDKAIRRRTDETGIYRSLLEADAGNQDLRLSIVNASIRHADLLVQRGRLDAALALLGPAMDVAGELRRLDPENTFVQQLAASALAALAEIDYFQGRPAVALEQLQAAESLAADLVAKDAAVVEWGLLLQQIRVRSSRYRMRQGEAELSTLGERLQRVHDALAGMAEASPGNLEIAALRAEAQLDSTELEQRRGSPAAARRRADEVIRLLDSPRSRLPPRSLATLAVAGCVAGQPDRANAIHAELAAMRYAHPDYLARGRCEATGSVTD